MKRTESTSYGCFLTTIGVNQLKPRFSSQIFIRIVNSELNERLSVILTLCVCSVAQLCLTLCDPMGCRPPGSSDCGIFRQEYCSGFPFSTPRDLPNPGIKPTSSVSAALAGRFFTMNHLGSPDFNSET